MYGDDHKHLFTVHFNVEIAPRERWIGVRRISHPSEEKQEWKNRVGSKQDWQVNILPCIGIWFSITHWKKIKEEKKKRG